MDYTLGVLSKKSLLIQSHKNVLLFSSKSATGLGLICRSRMHFDLIFVHGIRVKYF